MAKVIGCVPMDRVTTWEKQQRERKEKKAQAMARKRAAKRKIAKEKEYVPFNMQLRSQLRRVMNSTPSLYYINLPKYVG